LEVVLFPTNSTGQPVVYGPDYAVLDGKTFLDCPVAYFTREIFQYTLRAAGDVLGQSSNHIHDAVVTHWLLDSLTHSEDELAQLGYVWKVMDVRIETEGTWTRGMCVVDERGYEPVDPDNLQQIHAGKNAWHGRRPNKLRCLMDLDAQRCTKRVLACLGVE
jgi:inosine-uridine nucleoside N-ribohydrolase